MAEDKIRESKYFYVFSLLDACTQVNRVYDLYRRKTSDDYIYTLIDYTTNLYNSIIEHIDDTYNPGVLTEVPETMEQMDKEFIKKCIINFNSLVELAINEAWNKKHWVIWKILIDYLVFSSTRNDFTRNEANCTCKASCN